MMTAMVVALVAVLVMLLAGAVVAAARLTGAVRQLLTVVNGLRRDLEPLMTELQDNSDITRIEVDQVQASVAALRSDSQQARD